MPSRFAVVVSPVGAPDAAPSDVRAELMSRRSLRARLADLRSAQGADAGSVLTLNSGYRLDRALTRRLTHRYGASQSMRPILRMVIAELLAFGMTGRAILGLLSQMVEQSAAMAGVDKKSILTGEPDWRSTQVEVMTFARAELKLEGGAA